MGFRTPIYSSTKEPILREYDSSTTWTKPNGLKEIWVVCVGGGGGGGAGRCGASGTTRRGGMGGAGAAVVWRRIKAEDLDSTVTITIGSGGPGGAGVGSNTNGTTGTTGGSTSFGSLVIANGGTGGLGGNQPGNTATNTVSYAGGLSNTSTPNNRGLQGKESRYGSIPQEGLSYGGDRSAANGCPGAGRGAQLSTGNAQSNGPAADGVRFRSTLVSGGSAGTGTNPGNNGTDNAAPSILFSTKYDGTLGIGTGGSGGGRGANGGNGGNHGAGGGGGGAEQNGVNTGFSGAGGNGGGGLLKLIEFY